VNATAASLIGLLESCGGSLTGADLVRTAETVIGDFWSLTRSQVYRELASLAADGLLAAGPPGPREARPYTVTAVGRDAFLAWLAADPPAETIRFPLLLVVGFGRHLPPGRLADMLSAAEAVHRKRLGGYRELDARLAREGADAFQRATLSFGVHYEEAVLRWFAELPAEVRDA